MNDFQGEQVCVGTSVCQRLERWLRCVIRLLLFFIHSFSNPSTDATALTMTPQLLPLTRPRLLMIFIARRSYERAVLSRQRTAQHPYDCEPEGDRYSSE